MENFAERLKSTFATLVRPLTPEDGQPEAIISVAEARLGLRLPAVLREYYLLTGRLDRFNRAHNQLRRPEEWSVDRGKLVFLEENQCVVFWGVEVGTVPEDDPPVYQAENVRGRATEWYLEHKRCSEFLIVMLHLLAVWGGYEFLAGSEITDEAHMGRSSRPRSSKSHRTCASGLSSHSSRTPDWSDGKGRADLVISQLPSVRSHRGVKAAT